MFYTIRGEVDAFEDTGYDRPKKGGKPGEQEHIDKFRLSLLIPGTSELVSVDLSAEAAPKLDVQEKWENERQYVSVTAESMRHLKGETDGRAWSMISFTGVEVKEISPAEMKAIADARRKQRAAKKAAKKAAAAA